MTASINSLSRLAIRLVRLLVPRLLTAVVFVCLLASAALVLARLAPGDFTSELVGTGLSAEAIDRERSRAGLSNSVGEHYRAWLAGVVRFDLGTSLRFGRPVGELVAERAVNSGALAATALLVATLLGVPLGIVTGSRPTAYSSTVIRAVSIVCVSLPPLLVSMFLALLAATTGWFPVGGMGGEGGAGLSGLGDMVWHLVLPATALGLPIAATFERLQSQAMSETIRQPFILMAQGRGVPHGRIVWRHALKVAVRPVLSVYGVIVGSLLSGSFAVELVMAWPGLGLLMYDALISRDVHLVAGCAAAGATFLVIGSTLSDVLLAWADPRAGGADRSA